MIATAIALPVTVLLAFAFTAGRGTAPEPRSPRQLRGPLPAISVPAPPAPGPATETACVKVLAGLPVQLTDNLPPRRTDTDSALVRAWGDPAVVLRCGVARPAGLQPLASSQLIEINGVNWLPDQTNDATVFTSVDRSVYVEVSVPKRTADQPMSLLATAVATLPAVCTTIDPTGKRRPGMPFCGSRG